MKRLLLPVALLALASCREFQLERSYLAVEVDPAVARKGTVVAVHVSGAGLGATATPEVRLLGQLLPPSSGGDDSEARTYTYLATGAEPEGVDLVIDVTAGSLSRSARVRFDFTPPEVLAVASRPLTVRPDEQATVDLTTSEPLAAPPVLALAGRADPVPCSADPGDPRLFHCALTVSASDPPGWQRAATELTDLAGNVGPVPALPLDLVVDRDQALAVADPVVTPPVAARGTRLDISFATSRRLAGPPEVRVGAAPAQLVGLAGDDGVWRFEYTVAGTELGPEPAQAPVAVAARIGEADHFLDRVDFDLRPPRPVSVRADREQVGLPASGTNAVAVDIACDEPLSGLSATVQARALSCESPGGDPAAWRCSYLADGTEFEGPQRLVLWLSDAVGNAAQVTTDELFSFDYSAQLDADRLFVVGRFGVPPAFAGDPGAAEPGATLEVRPTGQAQPLLVAQAAEDGSVAEQGALGSAPVEVEVRETDRAGNVSAWLRPRERFVADPSHKPADGRTDAWTWVGGTDAPELAEFRDGADPSKPSPEDLAAADGNVVALVAPKVPTPTWVKAPNPGYGPAAFVKQPLVYVPGAGVMHLDLDDLNPGVAWLWTGTAWDSYDLALGPRPAFWDDSTYDLTFDPTSTTLLLFGKNTPTGGTAVGPFAWLGQFSPPLGSAATPLLYLTPLSTGLLPSPRQFAAMAFDRTARRSLLFGGWWGSQDTVWFTETWLFDGAAWSQSSPNAQPAPRESSAMAHDRSRGRTVMFGGFTPDPAHPDSGYCDQYGCMLRDTWEWTGADWVQRRIAGPSARQEHAMAYHAVERRTVLYGGWRWTDRAEGRWEANAELWQLDGRGWARWPTPDQAPDLSRAGMAYDERRGRLVLFGGRDGEWMPNVDTWELTEAGLVPAVMARLEVSDGGRLPSRLTFRADARASTPRAELAAQAVAVRAWDYPAARWVTLATAPASEAVRTVSASVAGADVARFMPGQTLYVLVTAPPSSVAGEAKLEVDAIAVSADW